jgi:hypothetical protein
MNRRPGRILETKRYDELKDVEGAAAERWLSAVNSDGQFGQWAFRMVTRVSEVSGTITSLVNVD